MIHPHKDEIARWATALTEQRCYIKISTLGLLLIGQVGVQIY